MAQSQLSGEAPRPMPTRRATWAVYDIFRDSEDNQVFVAAVSDGQWRDLCSEFGLTALAADPELETNQGRVDQRDRIHRELQAALSQLSLSEIEEKCTRRGLPVAPVNTPADLTSDPHLVASGALAATDLPTGQRVDVPLLPLTFGGARLGLRSDVPEPGRHNAHYRDSPAVPVGPPVDQAPVPSEDDLPEPENDLGDERTQSQ